MPNKTIVSEGKTTNEAIELGLKQLNVTKNMVNIKVLDEEKKSFFSILTPRVVKVEISLKDEDELKKENGQVNSKNINVTKKEMKPVSEELIDVANEDVKVFLDDFFKKIGNDINYIIKKDDFGLIIVVNGESAGFLIGYRGETLYSLQNIISIIANKKSNEKIRVILDIEGYKQKRESTLESLALRLAKTVEKTKNSVTLEPMQAYERKIIHSKLQDNPKIKTESIGEEPYRKVVISYKK